ncbi:MAG: peptidoglycan-binding protein [Alphaproteobacteria bacterium]|nr:peptidoglycan-binding protein [Alphaproteobacteria bacterium]
MKLMFLATVLGLAGGTVYLWLPTVPPVVTHEVSPAPPVTAIDVTGGYSNRMRKPAGPRSILPRVEEERIPLSRQPVEMAQTPIPASQPLTVRALITTGSLPQTHVATAGRSPVDLVSRIQGELKRLGCFDGRITGRWQSRTKQALARFLARANAQLPVETPDMAHVFILRNYVGGSCQAQLATAQKTQPAEPAASRSQAPTGMMALGANAGIPAPSNPESNASDNRASVGAEAGRVRARSQARQRSLQRKRHQLTRRNERSIQQILQHPLGTF